jgi:Piwi domain.
MKLHFIEEPEMSFGTGSHVDIKFGIMNHCVLDYNLNSAPRKINIGIIGNSEEIEKFLEWIEKGQKIIAAKPSEKRNLFPPFPGFSTHFGFCSEIVCDKSAQRSLANKDLLDLSKLSHDIKIKELVELYESEIEYLTSKNHNLNVIICTLPRLLAKSMSAEPEEADEHDEKPITQKKSNLDFRRMLKASTQKYKVPIQIILPSTYDNSIKTKFKVGKFAEASLQDEATIAWNFYTALYYKAGGIPWRLKRDPHDLQTCFIGISFYRTLDDVRLQSSVAQVFNERGEGMIIRGGIAKPLKDDKQIHLDSLESERLILNSIQKYKQEHRHSPARVVIHKSSDFDQDEINGITSAMNIERVDIFDLISISKSITRLHRPGKYPPLRGTFWELDDENTILYTKGSVDFFQTYPGLYVPKTLKIMIAYTNESHKTIAAEILALTKMNWNNTQLDNAMPITIKAARQVGEILKYIPDDAYLESNYCYYM